jgi:hypothetical protein
VRAKQAPKRSGFANLCKVFCKIEITKSMELGIPKAAGDFVNPVIPAVSTAVYHFLPPLKSVCTFIPAGKRGGQIP